MKKTEFSELLGKTLTQIKVTESNDYDNDEILFECLDGSAYKMMHYQDCCELVYIQDIVGDLDRLLNSPILLAEEIEHDHCENPDGLVTPNHDDSFKWTFYKLATNLDSVTLRWFGTSNGYYSESVDFKQVRSTKV